MTFAGKSSSSPWPPMDVSSVQGDVLVGLNPSMPILTRWFVKSAFVYFFAALAVALILALQAPLHLAPVIGSLMPVYFHLFMVGSVPLARMT